MNIMPSLEELDMTMTDIQASKFVRQMMPPGQGSLLREKLNMRMINGEVPTNDIEMIGQVSKSVKINYNFIKNVKNLGAKK